MTDQVFVQVRFKEQTEIGEFNDALYFSQVEYDSKTQDEINNLKQARVDNWVNSIKNAPPSVEPTNAQLEAEKAELQARIAVLDEDIAKIGK